ncbi:hypothetical protein LX36DRAFT_658015 [Colletotrichum falcatum]|nr:hypothetical protein LX36DRAFT_658015 [Colletotrichum falcatum]
MRYENWDVLLFPGSDHVPLKEFRTECHLVPDPESLPLSRFGVPSLNTFVPSLCYNSPFSISILSWGKPSISQATRSYSNHPELVLFEVHVHIDGRLVSTAILNQDRKGPYSIQHSFVLTKNGEIDFLRFPAFHSEILQQRLWSPVDDFGRIKVSITESFPRDSATTPFERVKNVVVFSFQHAPLEILENSAIAWPNPIMWQSALFNNTLPKPELSGPKLQDRLGLSYQSSAEDTTCSHAVFPALASLQPPTKAGENDPYSAQAYLASNWSPDSGTVPMVRNFDICHGIPHSGVLDPTAMTVPELGIQRNLCKFSETNGNDHTSSLFDGLSWSSDTFQMPFGLAGPSYLDLKEQCDQTVRSGLPVDTHAAADNVPNPMADASARLTHYTPYPKARASSPEPILHHPGSRSSGIKRSALPAPIVVSRKERRTLHAAETAASSKNPTTNIIQPGAGQKVQEPVFALASNTTTADRTPSLQIQPQRLLEVSESFRRSASLGGNVTSTEKQEVGLSTTRGLGNRNFTPLVTQGVAGGAQLHG